MSQLSPSAATAAPERSPEATTGGGSQAPPGAPPTGPPFEAALGAELARTAQAEGQEAQRNDSPHDRREETSEQAEAVATPAAS
ncbi:MAG TPA: hypothetical protein VMB05_17175, partial [Solirubrobacteraceae bacterium]|nr:hypothetical protein [Solirubrobacteraceae bacterium]